MSDDFNENPLVRCPKCKCLGAEVIFDMDTWHVAYPGLGEAVLTAIMPMWRCLRNSCCHTWDHEDYSDYIRMGVEADWIATEKEKHHG